MAISRHFFFHLKDKVNPQLLLRKGRCGKKGYPGGDHQEK